MHTLSSASKDWHIQDFATTAEWARERKNGVGASSVGMLLGMSHYSKNTPLRLYNILQGIEEDDPPSFAMEMGHRMEPVISDLFRDATDCIIMEESAHDFLCIDEGKPWRRVSPDRFFWLKGTDPSAQTVDTAEMLEIKYIGCFDERHRSVAITPDNFVELYPEYYAQVQYQMGVCRKNRIFIAWFDKNFPQDPFHYLEIEFNRGFFELAMKTVDSFWNDNILACTPPEETRNEEDLFRKFPRPVSDSVMTADDDILGMWRRNRVLERIKKGAETLQSETSAAIKGAMGLNERLLDSEGNKLVVWGARKGSRRFDEKAFKDANPALWEKYVRESAPTRTIRYGDLPDEVYDAMAGSLMNEILSASDTAAES